MKKLLPLLFLLAIGLATVTSCEKDKKDDLKSKIVGTWQFSKVEIGEVSTTPSMYAALVKQYASEMNDDILKELGFTDFSEISADMTFYPDGKYQSKENGNVVEEGTYLLQNNDLIVDGEKICTIGFEGDNKLIMYIDITEYVSSEVQSQLGELGSLVKLNKFVVNLIANRK